MTFNVQSWGRISSSCNNKITTLQDGSFVGAPNLFTYASSTDAVATIAAANYFNNVAVELNVGDNIYVVGSDTQIVLSVATVVVYPPAVTTQQSVSVGDVDGPAGATDKALVRFNGNTGKIIQNGVVLESDLGDLTLVRTIQNAAGTVALPSYTFTGDTDTGLWHSAANTIDLSTNAFRVMQWVASPALSVNYTTVTASATGNPVLVSAAGTDTNIGIGLIPKGTGAVQGPVGAIATPGYTFTGDVDTGMWHSGANTIDFSTNGLETLQLGPAPASSVNYLNIIPAVNNGIPSILALGTSAVIDVGVAGTGNNAGLFVAPSSTGTGGIIYLSNPAGTFYAAIQAGVMASTIIWKWALTDGSAGQVLSTDGAGNLSFVNNAQGTWVSQASTPVTMVANTEYIAQTAGLLTFNMPALAAVGDTFEIAGNGAGGWLIQMAAAQVANLNSTPTSAAGSLASTNRYNTIKLVCTVANTTFTVLPPSGVITVA